MEASNYPKEVKVRFGDITVGDRFYHPQHWPYWRQKIDTFTAVTIYTGTEELISTDKLVCMRIEPKVIDGNA